MLESEGDTALQKQPDVGEVRSGQDRALDARCQRCRRAFSNLRRHPYTHVRATLTDQTIHPD